MVSVLPQITEVPFHPIQPKMLKLILDGISSSPGVVSAKLEEAISSSLVLMLKRYAAGEIGMLSETFITICSIFVSLVKCPSASGSSTRMPIILEASKHAVLASLSIDDLDSYQHLHSLALLKEAFLLIRETSSSCNSTEIQMRQTILEICRKHIVPWFITEINALEEDIILGILETLHFILLHSQYDQTLQLTHTLLSVSWFSLSFRCLGLYPTEKMKLRVYLMLSTIMDNILGNDSGDSIRAVASTLPTDPVDLLFLLAQKSNLELSSCHTAVLQILYVSSLFDEMQVSNHTSFF